MGHYARIDENNVVQQVIVANAEFIMSGAVGNPAQWIKTSYNTHGGVHYKPNVVPLEPSDEQDKALRKNYAGLGYKYDPVLDAFIPPRPEVVGTVFNSWVLDENTCTWVPPIPEPNDGKRYMWDEPTVSWVEIEP